MVSGGGSNLQALIDGVKNGSIPGACINLVLSSRAGAYARTRAEQSGIRAELVSAEEFPDEQARADEILRLLDAAGTDLLVLAGYMSILPLPVIRAYEGRVINIHPSLIPKHCGKGFYGKRVHQAVLDAGERESGATVHYVDDKGIDTGEIILQRSVPVEEGDTAETLAARVLELEHVILADAVNLCLLRGSAR